MSASAPRRLVGGVGYSNLRDGSAGPLLAERLARHAPAGTDVEDLSYSPIDVLFALERREPYDELVLVGAVERGDDPGVVRVRRWEGPADGGDALQTRIAEAVTGVISLENTLHILGHFGGLPPRVTVVEIEPADLGWGAGTTEPVARAMAEVEALLLGRSERPAA